MWYQAGCFRQISVSFDAKSNIQQVFFFCTNFFTEKLFRRWLKPFGLILFLEITSMLKIVEVMGEADCGGWGRDGNDSIEPYGGGV